ncbi:MAG: type II secretion system F family protein [Solirubrobacteraceae bacterium]|nr:type II secretion system F family protein [Solirubrobacteraceae bacterium]
MSTAVEPTLAERGRGILQIELTPKKVKPVHLMNFCRYLSVFLTAGIPILDALAIIEVDTPDKKLKQVIREISAALRQGDNLATAVAVHGGSLPNFFVSMVTAAEETGQIAAVLGQIAVYIERDIEARRKFKSALTYPSVVVGMSLVAVVVLVTFVLPRFVTFFKDFGAELPLPTRILVAVSEFVAGFGLFVLVGLVLVGLTLVFGTVRGKGRLLRDRAILRMPLSGKVIRFAVVERFCRVLSSMVQAGVPLPVALDLAATGASNRAFAEKLRLARREMIEGQGLSGPLAATGMFPVAAVQMMRVGEETGTLEERLSEISSFYGKEVEHRLKRLTDLLEPAAVVFVGLLVGFVAVAIVSAIYGVFQGTNLK